MRFLFHYVYAIKKKLIWCAILYADTRFQFNTHTHCFPKMPRHKLTHTLTYISKRKNIVIASFGFKRFPGLQTLHCPERGLFSGHTYNELIKLLVMCICVSMVILSACVVFFSASSFSANVTLHWKLHCYGSAYYPCSLWQVLMAIDMIIKYKCFILFF